MRIDVTAAIVAGAIVIAILLLIFTPTTQSHPFDVGVRSYETR